MKLTPWFLGDVHPVRVGVYERQYFREQLEPRYSYWNGEEWLVWGRTPNMAKEESGISGLQNLPWRGVMK